MCFATQLLNYLINEHAHLQQTRTRLVQHTCSNTLGFIELAHSYIYQHSVVETWHQSQIKAP